MLEGGDRQGPVKKKKGKTSRNKEEIHQGSQKFSHFIKAVLPSVLGQDKYRQT